MKWSGLDMPPSWSVDPQDLDLQVVGRSDRSLASVQKNTKYGALVGGGPITLVTRYNQTK
jgi:hypothetical protein